MNSWRTIIKKESLFITAIIMCSFFASCGVVRKTSTEKQISKVIKYHYEVPEESFDSDSLINGLLKRVDTFYYNKNKVSYREVELIISAEDSTRITSYALYLSTLNSKGKIEKLESFYIPLRPDGSLENPDHIKNGTDEIQQRWVCVYNDAGDRIEMQYYAKDYKDELRLGWIKIYCYDEKKNLIEETCYHNSDGESYVKSLYKYDKKNRRYKEEYSVVDSIPRFSIEISYKYNKYGDVESEESVNEQGEVYSTKNYKYVYNDYGRWIKKIEYNNGELIESSERKFEYYGIDSKGMGVDKEHLIQNEVWWRIEPTIHVRGTNGIYTIYLYDDGHFIEKNVKKISGKKYTRKGFYHYEPEKDNVCLMYTDKNRKVKHGLLPEKRTLARPHMSERHDSTSPTIKSLLSVRKLEKGEKAKYIH